MKAASNPQLRIQTTNAYENSSNFISISEMIWFFYIVDFLLLGVFF